MRKLFFIAGLLLVAANVYAGTMSLNIDGSGLYAPIASVVYSSGSNITGGLSSAASSTWTSVNAVKFYGDGGSLTGISASTTYFATGLESAGDVWLKNSSKIFGNSNNSFIQFDNPNSTDIFINAGAGVLHLDANGTGGQVHIGNGGGGGPGSDFVRVNEYGIMNHNGLSYSVFANTNSLPTNTLAGGTFYNYDNYSVNVATVTGGFAKALLDLTAGVNISNNVGLVFSTADQARYRVTIGTQTWIKTFAAGGSSVVETWTRQ